MFTWVKWPSWLFLLGRGLFFLWLALKLRKDVGLEWHSNLEWHVLGPTPWIFRKSIKPINYLFFCWRLEFIFCHIHQREILINNHPLLMPFVPFVYLVFKRKADCHMQHLIWVCLQFCKPDYPTLSCKWTWRTDWRSWQGSAATHVALTEGCFYSTSESCPLQLSGQLWEGCT